MRTHIEFRSEDLSAADHKCGAVLGEAVAKLIAAHLPDYGFAPLNIVAEDWGWRIDLENKDFPLFVGCGHYQEYSDGHLCFIEPSKPEISRWFKKISTVDKVESLANALEKILSSQSSVHNIRWWAEDEV